MSTVTEKWYVLFDGEVEDGSSTDRNPVGYPESMADDAVKAFDSNIRNSYVDYNLGQFLVEVSDVTKADEEKFLDIDLLNDLINSDFAGFETKEVKSFKSSLDDFIPEALNDDVFEDASEDLD